MSGHVDQPLPVANEHRSIQSMVRTDLMDAVVPAAGDVIADLVDREQLGIERYGTFLQPHNGRDALRDAYEEGLDLVCYLKQAIVEGRAHLEMLYYAGLTMTVHLKEEIQQRDAERGIGDAAV